MISVFCFHFIRSRPTTLPTELKLHTEQALGPGGGYRCYLCTCYYCWQNHTLNASFCTCILNLNDVIQNNESNHHSGKTLLQEMSHNLMLMWSNHEHTLRTCELMYSPYRQDKSTKFFISGRCRYLYLKPSSADSDTGLIISCIPFPFKLSIQRILEKRKVLKKY